MIQRYAMQHGHAASQPCECGPVENIIGYFCAYEDHAALVEKLVQALEAHDEAERASDADMEMRERAICEGWDNDPTGASHVVSAILRTAEAWKKAGELRRAAIAAAKEGL